VTSSIPDGEGVMTSTFNFMAETGTLGDLRFSQYLDEDVQSPVDDVFFTRGSFAGADLELFTVDNTEVYGVSHSGALSSAQGLANATFAGWAANTYNNMKPAITAGTQAVSPTGVNAIGPSFVHPELGLVYGPVDVVSVLAWDVDPQATSATIVTTLGGVPDIIDIPPPDDVIPEPSTLAIWSLLGTLAILVGYRRRRRVA
jgi:hypothetical protein